MQTFVTEIFKVKIGWLQELMNDIFKFIENLYSPRINFAIQARGSNVKI